MRRWMGILILASALTGCGEPAAQRSALECAPESLALGDPASPVRVDIVMPLDADRHWVVSLAEELAQSIADGESGAHVRLFDMLEPEGRAAAEAAAVFEGAIFIDDQLGWSVDGRSVWLLGDPQFNNWSADHVRAIVAAQLSRAGRHAAAPAQPAITPLAPQRGSRGELMMFCGAGLREPMEAARRSFEQRTGLKLRIVYGGSACLLAQVAVTRQTRPADLYLPGEDFYMLQAEQRGFLAQSRTVCYFIPVIMTRRGNPHNIRTLADLARPGLRVGVGEPRACAIGKTTVELLEKHNLTAALAPNIVMHAPTAPELGNAIKLGAIDAAINWDAVAAWYEDAADIVTLDPADNLIVSCPIGVMGFSRNAAAARSLLAFVAGDEGRAIFASHRYTIDLANPVYPHAPLTAHAPSSASGPADEASP